MSKAMETEPKLIGEKKDGQKCLVNKEKAKRFLNIMRTLAKEKELVKISKDAAVLILQTALFYFGCLNYIQEGQKMVDLLIDPVTFQEDFDDVDNLIERLCLKKHAQVVLAQIGLQ